MFRRFCLRGFSDASGPLWLWARYCDDYLSRVPSTSKRAASAARKIGDAACRARGATLPLGALAVAFQGRRCGQEQVRRGRWSGDTLANTGRLSLLISPDETGLLRAVAQAVTDE
jgi:hypothetical protein